MSSTRHNTLGVRMILSVKVFSSLDYMIIPDFFRDLKILLDILNQTLSITISSFKMAEHVEIKWS